jgi:antitoxin component HigA of HigAB toxin-antitoxin module
MKRDYESAPKEVEHLWGAKAGTPDGDRPDVLATLIDACETEQHAMDPPDPIEAIKFRMEQRGLTRRDLEEIIGTRTRSAWAVDRNDPPPARAPWHLGRGVASTEPKERGVTAMRGCGAVQPSAQCRTARVLEQCAFTSSQPSDVAQR